MYKFQSRNTTYLKNGNIVKKLKQQIMRLTTYQLFITTTL